jgi:hypothetical protein
VPTEKPFRFDETAWPLIVVTCPDYVADGTVASLVAFFEGTFERKERFALVIDTLLVKGVPGAGWRKDITAWSRDARTQENEKKYNAGSAIVLSSGLVRGIFVALGWMWKPASPITTAATLREGVDWCCEQLSRGGVPRSPKLLALQQSLAAGDSSRVRG